MPHDGDDLFAERLPALRVRLHWQREHLDKLHEHRRQLRALGHDVRVHLATVHSFRFMAENIAKQAAV